uniref:DELLA protein RGL1 n=1 Tax=Kalanchoe fedtschenkoi TaxID=63787 RepID=A0A7N0RIQ6_KALFE
MANELAATNSFSEEISYHDDDDQFKALDLCLSALACYPYPFLPIPENSVATSFSTTNNGNAAAGATFLMPEEPGTGRDSKRLKRSFSVSESLGSSDTNGCSSSYYGSASVEMSSRSLVRSSSVTSLPRLHFRDHIWTYTQRYLAAEAVEEAVSSFEAENGISGEDHQGNKDGMRLVQLLIACAEAVACRDKSHASALLSELRAHAVVFGSSFQRVASCFVQGLADRMTLLVQPLGSNGFRSPATMLGLMEGVESDKKAEGLSLVYELCPQIQFGHFVANSSILEAFEGESSVHVVDLGMTLGLPGGHQWRQLIHSLANRATGPPKGRLKVTAIGLHAQKLQAIGGELEVYAHSMNVNMVFSGINKCLENIRPEDFDIVEDEVLVVNSIFQLHCVVKESRGALNSVLRIIHKLQPKTLVLVEQDSNHNGPFFLGRFMEALHYYSAIFDSLDAMLPKYDTRRAKMEQFYFAEQIKNIVSCEGPERVERHERVDQWRRRMSRAGFLPVPIKMISQAKQWMARVKLCDGHTIVEEKGCLILGWKSKPIVAASCWKC